MPEVATAAEVARTVADVLAREGIDYAIGGAIALGYYAPPRATVDVDVNVFVPVDERLDEVLAVLGTSGFVPHGSGDRIRRNALEDGQFRGEMMGLRVDVFVPALPYYGELINRRREVVLFEKPIWILGPEDLAVLKLMFFRRKDLADVEAMLRNTGAAFDRSYVRRRLSSFVGEDDERLRALDAIERDVDRSP